MSSLKTQYIDKLCDGCTRYSVLQILVCIWNVIHKAVVFIFDVENELEAQLGVIISWIMAVLFAYVANRIVVFKSKNKKILKEMAEFIGARILTLLMEMGLTWFFFNLLNLTSNIWIIIVTFIIQAES